MGEVPQELAFETRFVIELLNGVDFVGGPLNKLRDLKETLLPRFTIKNDDN